MRGECMCMRMAVVGVCLGVVWGQAASVCPTETRELAGNSSFFKKQVTRTRWTKRTSKYDFDRSLELAYYAACDVKSGGAPTVSGDLGYEWTTEQLWAVSKSGSIWDTQQTRLDLALGMDPVWFQGLECVSANARWIMRIVDTYGKSTMFTLEEPINPAVDELTLVLHTTLELENRWPAWSSSLASVGERLEMKPAGGGATVVGLVKIADPGPDSKSTDEEAEEGDPVNAIDGNVTVSDADAALAVSGVPLGLVRHYNSIVDAQCGFGPGWSHSYSSALTDSTTEFKGDFTNWKVFSSADGARVAFEVCGDGTFQPPYDQPASLVFSNGIYYVSLGGESRYLFNTDGRLLAVCDAWDRRVDLSYDGPVLSRVEHDRGRALVFGYAGGRIASLADGDGTSLAAYHYDGAGRLVEVESYAYGETQWVHYAYADDGFSLTQRVARSGMVSEWSYATNAFGQATGKAVASVIDGAYFDTRLDYDASVPNRTQVTWHGGVTNRYREHVFNPVTRQLLSVKGPSVSQANYDCGIRYTRDAHGDLVQMEQFDTAAGESLWQQMAYDARHNVTNWGVGYNRMPSRFWSTVWHEQWQRPLSETDPEGNRIDYSYTNGSLATIACYPVPGRTNWTHFAYSDSGQLLAVTNANGHAVRWGYGADQQLAWQQDPMGQTVAYARDGRGSVTNITMSADDGSVSVGYDVDLYGNLLATHYPDGLSEQFAYDGAGRMTNRIDRAGRRFWSHYLVGGRRAVAGRMYEGVPVTIRSTYDSRMNTEAVYDPLDRAIERYLYDAQGRVVGVTNLEGQTMTMGYGQGSYLKSRVRFDGTSVAFGYTGEGLLASVTGPDDVLRFDYFGNGLPKEAVNGVTQLYYSYDGCGAVTSLVDSASGAVVQYGRNPLGNVVRMTTSGVDYRLGYDAAERLATLETDGASFTNRYYSYNGLLQSRHESGSGLSVAYSYDSMGRATSIRWTGADGQVVCAFTYGYNAVGMVTNVVRETGCTTSYGYDELDRLVLERTVLGGQELYHRQYTYDLADNRLAMVSPWGSVTYQTNANRMVAWEYAPTGTVAASIMVHGHADEPLGSPSSFSGQSVVGLLPLVPRVLGTHFIADAVPVGVGPQVITATLADCGGRMGRATQACDIDLVTSATYAYDQAGCLVDVMQHGSVTTSHTALAWNGFYQLTNVTVNGADVESYGYNANGLRVATMAEGAWYWHVYDGAGDSVSANHPVAEVGSDGALLRTYVWGGVDQLLAFTIYDGSTNGGVVASGTYYPLIDRQGTVHAIADEAGVVVESYVYDAWGRIRAVYNADGVPQHTASGSPFSPMGNHYLFQGRWYSWSSGYYYFRARWYDPQTGRWLSKDPIRINGGPNLYTFCANNPVNFVDPDGLFHFGNRPLGGGDSPWFPLLSSNPIGDLLNINVSHEHGFFDDGSGDNIGFGPEGRYSEDPKGRNYRMGRKHYDDALMREALKNVQDGDYSLLGRGVGRKNNCQDGASRLRREYRRLEREKKGKAKWYRGISAKWQ